MTISVWILKLFNKPTSHIKKVYVCFIFLCLNVFVFKFLFLNTNYSENDYVNNNLKILGLNIPANLDFAGEKVPQNDYEIKESLEAEFFTGKSWKKSSILLFQKARKWFPIIEPILKDEGIPDDFKYVAIIESHLSNVVSPMGAAGFWQLMPTTAQYYGLVITNDVDERYDVEKATYAACKHLKDAYDYFHNWTLSAAAYNVGIGRIQQELKKQGADNYYSLLLNKETGSFIYRVLAFKTVLSNPNHFGIKNNLNKSGVFPNFKIIKIDSSIVNLSIFAKQVGINIITLKTFNPWLISNTLANPDKHIYKFKIPKNKNIDLSSYFDDVFPQEKMIDTTSKQITIDTTKINLDTLIKNK